MSSTSNSLPPQTKIIWAALTFSQLIYAVVGGFVLSPQEGSGPDETLLYGLLGVALSTIAAAVLVIPNVVKVKSFDAVVTPFIVQWALVESVALYGLVGKVLGASNTYLFGLTFLAMTFMVILYPSEKRARSFVQSDPEEP